VGDRSFERLGAAAAMVATLAVGVATLFGLGGFGTPSAWTLSVWWASYLGFVAALLVDMATDRRRPPWLTEHRLLAVQVGTACVVYLSVPEYGWTAVLLVITAACTAFVLSARGTIAVVAGQTVVIGLGQAMVDVPTGEAMLATVLYASFQTFAALMVRSERREAAARAELATAHAELRASTALLSESSRTAERLRIARDLHDLVGHELTAMSLELEVASHHADGAARDHVSRAGKSAKQLLSDVRAAVGELRSEPAGLSAPLHALVDGLPGPTVSLRVVEEVEVDEVRALAVVRCVQEIVTNTLRHAAARHLWITVRASRDGVRVEARDDGRGVAVLRPGHGLSGMRERLEQLGGEVRLDSGEGRGFRVAVRVPAS
jgi:signal transduction histidine kinase